MGMKIWTAIAGQLGQIATLIVGSIGILVALRNQRRQLNAQMFIEFSGRFQQLLRLFPKDAWLANLNPSRPLPPSSQELTECVMYCFHYVADVYYLHRGGYVSVRLWRLWEQEIKRTLMGPVFQRELDGVATQFYVDSEFLQYLRSMTQGNRCSQHSTNTAAS
jgi:hypothetical protein